MTAIFRRKAIYEELHPETKQHVAGAHGANRAMGRDASDNLSFASSTAEATGKDKRSVERAAARGKALGDDLAEIADRVRRLSPCHRDPEKFHFEKWDIERALRRMARGERHG